MSAQITVSVAGSERSVPAGTTAADLFADEKRVVVARIGGELKDLTTPLTDGDIVEGVDIASPDGLDVLRTAGADISDEELEARRSSMGLETVATIIYTSGTTGRPKGCELTHLNFVELSRNAQAALPECVHEGSSTIMFLPLAHVFARFISVLAVAGGAKVAHTPDIKNLLPDLQGFKPTFILAVPRVFEKVYNSSMLKAEDASNVKA